jgi:hypothetical protein
MPPLFPPTLLPLVCVDPPYSLDEVVTLLLLVSEDDPYVDEPLFVPFSPLLVPPLSLEDVIVPPYELVVTVTGVP